MAAEGDAGPSTAPTGAAATAQGAAEANATPPADAEGEPRQPTAEQAPAPRRPTFADLGLSEPVLRAVADAGYLHPTPIQEQAIPVILMGRDVLGCAQTGTGKTASFTLPMLDILSSGRSRARMPRSLILEPTRELAAQVAENFVKYAKYLRFDYALIIGGESMGEQTARLARGVDVLIATPGRLLDLFERGGLLLTDVRILVIDEADRMLDMGFIPDVERIVSLLPRMRQTLFFSATMPPEIKRLADAFLHNPKVITVAPPATVAATVEQHLALVREHDKREALRRLLRAEDVKNALIFCNRKRDVDILCRSLLRHGFDAAMLHGDMTQPKRMETLERFKAGQVRLLVCSDVAARGIDIGGLSHVFNFDVPIHPEDYVHRIGRTGRAGQSGRAFTLATVEDDDRLAAIEKLIGKPIPRIQIEGLDPVSLDLERPKEKDEGRRRRGRGGRSAKTEAAAPRAATGKRGQPERKTAAKGTETQADRARLAARPAPRQAEPAEEERVVGFGGFVPDFILRPTRRMPAAPPRDAEEAEDQAA
ncbi:DEAD/DEAH box helicase [Elioraea thermophila]|uniref:DEAD/DEAH box helicase n=1 Tax=Elioraea thermophila TaxID=2185104 RepID=UPI000DF23E44|nr:DEAD/DEAH box helicase [Elioraea thermophila]